MNKVLQNRIPELVEKKEPPIITNIKNINERFCEWEWSSEIPIFETLLAKDKKNYTKIIFSIKK